MNHGIQHVFVVMNPKSGNAGQSELIREAVAKYFPPPAWTADIHEITGEDDVAQVCREACANGATLVIAAGGDGTVGSVANGLIGSEVPLGIVPLGTGNDLARILGIPLDLEAALQAIATEPLLLEIDALNVGGQYFLSNVSVGISPHIMDETSSAQKQRFGLLAYVWTTLRRLRLFRRRRYHLTIDGETRVVRASEVLISNTTLLQSVTQVFGPPEHLNDGQLEVYLVTARTLVDYLRMVWNLLRGRATRKELIHLTMKRSMTIESRGRRRLVQADGEVIGHTPVTVELAPRALRVAMPRPKREADAEAAPVFEATVSSPGVN
jgi:YegS/Rv2252/BmrU family lipid kinase